MKYTKVSKNRSLTEETEEKINQQIKMEGVSSQIYLMMASWCEKEGYENSANFLYGHSDEERMHMLKLMKYLNEAGGYAIAPDITDIKTDYKTLKEVFNNVLDHEIDVTISINELAKFSFEAQDFATFQFLQWYVMEQREEESLARRVLEIFEIIGEAGQGLWLIDQEIGKLITAGTTSSFDIGTTV